MSGADRAFDDGRYPDLEGVAECFLCGKPVDLLDPRRGFYTMGDEMPNGDLSGPDLPLHLSCLDDHTATTNPLHPGYPFSVACAYRRALDQMTDRQFRLLPRA